MAARETMSVAEIDIWGSAKLLIDQHGDEAAIHAATRAGELRSVTGVRQSRVYCTHLLNRII